MSRLRWSEHLFMVCFLAFAVGGSLLWPSETIWAALGKLFGGTVVALAVWLGALFFADRRSKEQSRS